MEKRILLAALLLVSIFCVGFVYRAQTQARQQWEYKTFDIPLQDASLNKLGAEGWELIAVDGSRRDPVFYFKRPK